MKYTKLFNDLYSMRSNFDSKNEMIKQKDLEIQSLSTKLNTLKNQKDLMNFMESTGAAFSDSTKLAVIDSSNIGLLSSSFKKNSKNKQKSEFFDKHVIQPLRGGKFNFKFK
jgi:hypothetical protein